MNSEFLTTTFDLYKVKILIIEDEENLSKSIAAYLKSESFLCECAYTFPEALEKIGLFDYDCILLDITLPGGSGLQLLQELKKMNKTDGVLIISAKNSLDDRLKGLKLGADDYLPKPFHMAELGARVHAIVRRRKFDGNDVVRFEEIVLDLAAKAVHVNAEKVPLTKSEFDLLLFLISNKNRVVSKMAIAEHLSGDDADLMDSFDFIYGHIKNLKKKLTAAGCQDYINTVYGLGYKFSI